MNSKKRTVIERELMIMLIRKIEDALFYGSALALAVSMWVWMWIKIFS